jgi:hypothetical protein
MTFACFRTAEKGIEENSLRGEVAFSFAMSCLPPQAQQILVSLLKEKLELKYVVPALQDPDSWGRAAVRFFEEAFGEKPNLHPLFLRAHRSMTIALEGRSSFKVTFHFSNSQPGSEKSKTQEFFERSEKKVRSDEDAPQHVRLVQLCLTGNGCVGCGSGGYFDGRRSQDYVFFAPEGSLSVELTYVPLKKK